MHVVAMRNVPLAHLLVCSDPPHLHPQILCHREISYFGYEDVQEDNESNYG